MYILALLMFFNQKEAYVCLYGCDFVWFFVQFSGGWGVGCVRAASSYVRTTLNRVLVSNDKINLKNV